MLALALVMQQMLGKHSLALRPTNSSRLSSLLSLPCNPPLPASGQNASFCGAV